MVCYIKLNQLKKSSSIPQLIDFDTIINSRTGEEYPDRKRSAHLRNLVFTLIPGSHTVKMQGSIHKFANNGENNNDRFSLKRFQRVTEELAEFISPDDLINVLEFGVNIKTPFEPSVFIRNLIAFGKQPLLSGVFANETYAMARRSQYLSKFYDKGVQQGLPGSNILRIEWKYLKMENLFKDGLTWGRLGSPETWYYLGNVLKDKMSEVVYFDPSIDYSAMSKREADLLKKGNNPFFWRDLTGSHVSRTRKEYKALVNQHGSLFSQLDELIDTEIEELVNSDQLSTTQKYDAHIGLSSFDNSVRKDELVSYDPLLFSHILPNSKNESIKKLCKVTGLDISMQKEVSRFISPLGVKFYYENHPEIFAQLKEILTNKWADVPLERQFSEIAHSIRNSYHSKRIHTQKAIKRLCGKPALFNNYELISQEKKNIANRS